MIKDFFHAQSNKLSESLKQHDWSSSVTLCEALREAWLRNRQVFIMGNGGSSANACHWANDFFYPVSKKIGSGIRIRSLSSNPAVITCIGNDEGYEHVFSSQLRVFAQPGDLVIVLSGSGNSPNILRALEAAKELKLRSFAVLGFSGGKALELADVPIHFQIHDMQLAEDFQLILAHLLMRALQLEENQPA